jgi:uncharacterized protein (DUF58 family)
MERASVTTVSVFTLPVLRVVLVAAFLFLLQTRLYLPALLLFGLLLLVETAALWSRLGLRQLEVHVSLTPTRLFPGENGRIQVSVKNGKRLPVYISLLQQLPPELSLDTSRESRNCVFLRSLATEALTIPYHAKRRGVYQIPPLQLWCSDALGLFRRELLMDHNDPLVVFPHLSSAQDAPVASIDLGGLQSAARPYFYDPVLSVGLRDYDTSLPARQIHWKASARQDHLFAKVLESSTSPKLLFVIDTDAFESESTVGAAVYEKALSLTATLAMEADERRIPFGLAANTTQTGRAGAVFVPVVPTDKRRLF